MKSSRQNTVDGCVVSSDVVRARKFLLGILICKGLPERRLYKSFVVKWLTDTTFIIGTITQCFNLYRSVLEN
jgi:hypothetical protein